MLATEGRINNYLVVSQWGSPHGHRNRIHWIRIPRILDSMWYRVSSNMSKRHEDYAHCTAGLDLTHCPRSIARSSDPDRVCVEVKWSLNSDIQIQGPVWRGPM